MRKINTLLSIIFCITINVSQSQTWNSMMDGLGTTTEAVKALAIAPNGDIYAGGTFTGTINYIAKWNGSSWSGLGSGVNGPVYSIGIKTASDIYVGGIFSSAGGTAVSNIARWDGTNTWTDVAGGFNDTVKCVFASSYGSVYAGGTFSALSGGTAISHIAKYANSQWTALGSGIPAPVNAIIDDNSGNTVYVGCDVSNNPVQKWDGATWSNLSGLSGGRALALAKFNNDLYAGGEFTAPSRAGAKWSFTSSTWGTIVTSFNVGHKVNALYVRAGVLYIGGNFTGVGLSPAPNYIGRITVTNNVASPVRPMTVSSELTNGEVFAITNTNGRVIAGGKFTTPTSPVTNNVAITSTTINVDELNDNIINKNFYPNPVNGQAHLKISTKSNLSDPEMKIFDIQSKLIDDISVVSVSNGRETEFVIDCKNLSTGNYYYMVMDNGQVVLSDKFIVE